VRLVPLSEAKVRLSEIAEEVDRTHERVHITRDGRSYVVLVAVQDLESLEATLGLLSDPAAIERVQESERAIAAGEVTTRTEVAALMEERRRRERPGA
jgi:antitoxin YefM